jgi:hypothetical protein
MVAALILPEIAAKYGRPERTIGWWRFRYDWPEPTGTRGRWDEYDPAQVDAAIRAILALGDDDADPDELLDAKAAAAEAGISWGTVRSDISRNRWPAPDEDKYGVRRWKRSTVRAEMACRRPNRRRRAAG